MPFHSHKLPNGLQLIGETAPSARSVAVGFFVRTGSRDDTPAESGVSHFLEHMMFKGTPRRSALDVNLDFDRIGANNNASTSEENTIYYAAVLPEYLLYIRVVRLPNCVVPLPLKLRLTSHEVLVVDGVALAEAMSLPTT